jgi:hypothetical protein
MLFADDVMLIDEGRICIDRKLELWIYILELRILDLIKLKVSI